MNNMSKEPIVRVKPIRARFQRQAATLTETPLVINLFVTGRAKEVFLAHCALYGMRPEEEALDCFFADQELRTQHSEKPDRSECQSIVTGGSI